MLKIQKGKYRGRAITLPPRISGNVNCTPALLKEAFFQLMENETDSADRPFFDLCGGSGQMAFEALSNGYYPVHISEVSPERLRFLTEEARKYKEKIFIHKRDFRRMAPLILSEINPVAYLDPPYSFWNGRNCGPADRLLFNLIKGIYEKKDKNTVILAIQGPESYEPDSSVKEALFRYNILYSQYSRDYRGNHLTVIRLSSQVS